MIQLWGTFTLMSNKSLYELAVFCILALHAFPFQIRDREKETDIDVNLCILLCMVLWGFRRDSMT